MSDLKVVVPETIDDDIQIINEENIIDVILNLMEKVEDFVDMSGQKKKNYVLKSVRTLIGVEPYKRYEYFISSFIDFVVSVSKGKKINLNNIKKKYCCF
jgi:hypothetical protein